MTLGRALFVRIDSPGTWRVAVFSADPPGLRRYSSECGKPKPGFAGSGLRTNLTR